MTEYYFEYKEGDNKYSGVLSAPTDHAAHSMVPDLLESVDWATKQGEEFVGIAMMTPANQLDHSTEHYVGTQRSPYTREDWSERLERAQKMHEEGENVIDVYIDE